MTKDVRPHQKAIPTAWLGDQHNAEPELHQSVLDWLTDETGIELNVLDIWVHVAGDKKSFGALTPTGERAVNRWIQLYDAQLAVKFSQRKSKTAMQRMIVRLETERAHLETQPLLQRNDMIKLLGELKDSAIRWNEP